MPVPTIQSRVSAMGQQQQNPQFPPTWSMQNLQNFGSDIIQGAGYGAQGGIVGGAVSGAYRAANAPVKVSPIAQPTGTPPAMSPALTQLNDAVNTPPKNPSFLSALGTNLKTAVPQAQAAGKLFDSLLPQPTTPQSQLQQFTQQSPQAQSGPTITSNAGSSVGQKPYFSFEKFFSSTPQMRPLIGNATGMPQSGDEDDPNQVRNQENQQPQVEQWGRPIEGPGFWHNAKGYAYDVSNWLHDSPWSQRLVGAGAAGAAGLLSGGASLPASNYIAAGAGSTFRGLTGQLKNFFAERQQQTQQQQQQNPMQGQPSILNNQANMGIA